MIEIIKHTPIWVFVLFIALLYLGYSQSKDRQVNANRIFILPVAMILLSLYGILSAFGTMVMSYIVWFLAGSISLLLGLKIFSLKRIEYNPLEKVFHIPGSWIPMLLILVIFFIKYFVGVVVAKELPMIHQIEFILCISILYGCISGLFLSRSIIVLRSK